MRVHTLILVSVPLALLGCASVPQSSDNGTASANANRITAEQIAQADAPTAYDVIDRLQRTWWRDLSAGASGSLVVYWSNNQRIDDGSRDVLRQILSKDVVLLERFKSADAIARFGLEAKGGAIVVTRR